MHPLIASVVKYITGREVMMNQVLVPLHPLSNIEITKYFNYESRLNGLFWRHNLPRIKDGKMAINLHDK